MTEAEAMERLRACLTRMRERAAQQRAPVPPPKPTPAPTSAAAPPPHWQDTDRENHP